MLCWNIDNIFFCCQWLEKRPYAAKVMGFFPIFSSILQDRACSFIVPSLQIGCNKGENLCFPINMWVISKLKAGKWTLGAGLYLASSSLTFFIHRDSLNALLLSLKSQRGSNWKHVIIAEEYSYRNMVLLLHNNMLSRIML